MARACCAALLLSLALMLATPMWAAAQDTPECASLGTCTTPGDPGYRVAIDSLDFFTVLNPSALIANAVYNATDISLCPTTRTNAVVVKGRDIANLTTKTGALLQSLSIFACTNINADPDANYLVGTLSTAAPNVGVNAEALNAIARQFPIKAFGVCMAVQPCSNDYLFGFKGFSMRFPVTIPPLPPAVGEASLNAISVSQSGTGARINNRWYSLPLWRWTHPTDYTELGPDLTGNLLIDASVTLNWGFTRVKPVAEKTLFNVSMGIKGQVKMLVKYANPVRFALQTAVSPVVNLGPFAIDLKTLGLPTANFLFYVEHYNDNKWDMYAGVQAVMNVSRLTNMLPGDMGRVLSAMVDVVVPSTRVILNIHASNDGGGVRIFFQQDAGIAQAFANILRDLGVDIPSFKTGLGFRLSVSKSGKVFGYVALGGREWGTAACVRNSDCDDGNVCTLGICTVQYGCARSYQRTPYSQPAVGVCPDGTYASGLLCYTRCPADKPFTPTPADQFCYEECGCATTLGAASLCSGPCRVFGRTVSKCGCGIRKRNVILKRNSAGVEKRCPSDKPDKFLNFCYNRCRNGYRSVDGGCVLNSGCPPDFPVSCGGSGLGSWCVRAGSKLGCAQLSAAFGACPAS